MRRNLNPIRGMVRDPCFDRLRLQPEEALVGFLAKKAHHRDALGAYQQKLLQRIILPALF